MESIVEHFKNGFEQATQRRTYTRRIGAELKFPFVDAQGQAGSEQGIEALWRFLGSKGWRPIADPADGRVVGVRMPGPMNDTLASCETGFCKTEFSLAHVGDLHELDEMVRALRVVLAEFSERNGFLFLGCGIQPITPPSRRLEMKKSRNSFWNEIFGSNRVIDPCDGDDVHLFTISASSQVHIDVASAQAVKAVNVFNGFSGAQIALTANSNIWKGQIDPEHKCVGEKFWDWWIPDSNRYGVPLRPFGDLEDYVRTIVALPPVYVRRDGVPIGLMNYESFYDYYTCGREALGVKPDGQQICLEPEPSDIDQHSTFYWYNARISRYYTLENRVCDQQPPDEMLSIAALTLGLVSNLNQSWEEIRSHGWSDLRKSREAACKKGMQAQVGRLEMALLAKRMVDLAEIGLAGRGLGEEIYLSPLKTRLKDMCCPADEAERLFARGGVSALCEKRRI